MNCANCAQVGLALLGGLGVVLTLIPINMLLTKKIAAVSARMMAQKVWLIVCESSFFRSCLFPQPPPLIIITIMIVRYRGGIAG